MFAILRTKRLSDISSACAHNLRTKHANNVDKTKSHLNEIIKKRESKAKDPLPTPKIPISQQPKPVDRNPKIR